MAKIRPLLRFIDTINEWAGKIAGFLIIAIVGVIIYEVIARYGFNSPTEWSFETSAFLFLGYIVLGGGYTLLYGEHVNTDIIYSHIPLRGRALVDLITSVLSLLFCLVLLWEGGKFAWSATLMGRHTGTPWNPPVFIVLWVLPVGGGLLLIQVVAKFIRDMLTVTGRQVETPYEH